MQLIKQANFCCTLFFLPFYLRTYHIKIILFFLFLVYLDILCHFLYQMFYFQSNANIIMTVASYVINSFLLYLFPEVVKSCKRQHFQLKVHSFNLSQEDQEMHLQQSIPSFYTEQCQYWRHGKPKSVKLKLRRDIETLS